VNATTDLKAQADYPTPSMLPNLLRRTIRLLLTHAPKRQPQPQPFILSLPTELLLDIVNLLNYKSVVALSVVNWQLCETIDGKVRLRAKLREEKEEKGIPCQSNDNSDKARPLLDWLHRVEAWLWVCLCVCIFLWICLDVYLYIFVGVALSHEYACLMYEIFGTSDLAWRCYVAPVLQTVDWPSGTYTRV
jgi:F-box domain